MNGDGFDDLLIGVFEAGAPGKLFAGESYVVFGSGASTGTIDLANLASAGITISGVESGDRSGISVSGAGDVNGDGFDDLVIGAYQADASGNDKSNAGDSYLIFGMASGWSNIDLANLGTAGISIFGGRAEDRSGRAVSGAGDVNGDGFDDLIVGAHRADASNDSRPSAGDTAAAIQ